MAIGKKTGGRRPGSVNKLTAGIREPLKLFLENKWPDMEKKFSKLSPKDQWLLYEKLLSYAVPRYSHVNMALSQMSEQDLELIIGHLKENLNHEHEDEQDQ